MPTSKIMAATQSLRRSMERMEGLVKLGGAPTGVAIGLVRSTRQDAIAILALARAETEHDTTELVEAACKLIHGCDDYLERHEGTEGRKIH